MRDSNDERINWALVILMFILGWILSPYIIEILDKLK